MRSGALRDTLQLQRRVQVGVTALNAPNYQWQDWLDPIFCEIMPRRGREVFDEGTGQRISEDVWRFRVRYDEIIGSDSTMRVVLDEQNFDIESIQPDRQRRGDAIIEAIIRDLRIEYTALAIAILVAIPDGTDSVVYDGFTVTASGGTAPYTYSVSSGALPTGLSLDASTGAVSGTPTVVGAFAVAIQVEDASQTTAATPSFTITIAA